MAYASDPSGDLGCCVGNKSPVAHSAAAGAAGYVRHVLDTVLAWGENGDDREIAGFLERSGGRLTDNIEREMMRRRMVSNWTVHG